MEEPERQAEGVKEMKRMKTTEAVGQVLCHDITQIIPGVTKDAVFRKGHIIREEDIPVLLSVGKDSVYIWENDETMMHEMMRRRFIRNQYRCTYASIGCKRRED